MADAAAPKADAEAPAAVAPAAPAEDAPPADPEKRLEQLQGLKDKGLLTLLTLLVNTLGDPVKKIASRAIYFLQTLLSEHPTMVTVVVKEVQQLLFRPNIKLRAQAYAITFLTQIEFNSRMQDVASRLVALYFDFFKVRNTEVERERLSQGSRVRVRD